LSSFLQRKEHASFILITRDFPLHPLLIAIPLHIPRSWIYPLISTNPYNTATPSASLSCIQAPTSQILLHAPHVKYNYLTIPSPTIYFKNEREKLIVGKNCHSALRRLRLPNKDRTVWIDAICIDQENLTERSSQVRLMNEVYSRAARVMVILGDQVPECRLLQKRSEWFIKMFGGDLSTVSALPNSRGLDLLNIVPSSKSVIDQLEKLFEEPWFKRTWVLQEVYKKRRITVIYGSASLPITVLKWICYGDSGIKSTRGALPRPLTFLWTSQVEYSTPQFNLWNRLYKSRECLASNPRDKIFALKSLLGARQSEIDHLIDYTQSGEETSCGVPPTCVGNTDYHRYPPST
jgi:hypothetical protein